MNLITPYQPLPVEFVKGKGVWLWDNQDQAYLDGLAGIAVCNLGHCHPAVSAAIADQAHKLMHTSNYYTIREQHDLAATLCDLSGMEQAFFANSGAEANEAAIKLARIYGHQRGIALPTIVVMEGAFHGRTMATITASANPHFQAGFEPLLPGFIRIPYNDIPALQALHQHHNNIVAVLVEPLQGEGGVNIPADNYLSEIRSVCNEFDWLMILDEVQTGVGRLGTFYAYQQENIIPDILTSAKGLGNGFPVAVCLMSGKAVDLFSVGKHGSTFGGNPLACRVAQTVINTLQSEKIIESVIDKGNYCLNLLKDKITSPLVKEIRGKGLLIGVVFEMPVKPLLSIGLEEYVLFSITAEKVLRLAPPLIITFEEINELTTRVAKCIDRFTASQSVV